MNNNKKDLKYFLYSLPTTIILVLSLTLELIIEYWSMAVINNSNLFYILRKFAVLINYIQLQLYLL